MVPGMSVKQMPFCFLFSLLFWCHSSGVGCENFLQLCLWAEKQTPLPLLSCYEGNKRSQMAMHLKG